MENEPRVIDPTEPPEPKDRLVSILAQHLHSGDPHPLETTQQLDAWGVNEIERVRAVITAWGITFFMLLVGGIMWTVLAVAHGQPGVVGGGVVFLVFLFLGSKLMQAVFHAYRTVWHERFEEHGNQQPLTLGLSIGLPTRED